MVQERGSLGEPTAGVQRRLNRHSLLGRSPSLSRQQLDTYASQVMALDEAGESYAQKIHRLFMEAGGFPLQHCASALQPFLPTYTKHSKPLRSRSDALSSVAQEL